MRIRWGATACLASPLSLSLSLLIVEFVTGPLAQLRIICSSLLMKCARLATISWGWLGMRIVLLLSLQ